MATERDRRHDVEGSLSLEPDEATLTQYAAAHRYLEAFVSIANAFDAKGQCEWRWHIADSKDASGFTWKRGVMVLRERESGDVVFMYRFTRRNGEMEATIAMALSVAPLAKPNGGDLSR